MNPKAASEAKLLVYPFGGIPDQLAWMGTTLSFRIDWDALGVPRISMGLEEGCPPPAGPFSLDDQGVFRYDPNEDDTDSFLIHLAAELHGQTITQQFKVTPVPSIVPERQKIVSEAEPPQKESSTYITISRTKNSDESENHLVSGMRLVFDEKSEANHLFRSYNRDPGNNKLPDVPSAKGMIRRLTLCADELVVRGALFLPETEVQIFARKLVFEKQDGKAGCIVTSPLPYANHQAEVGQDGRPGRKAGDMAIYARSIETEAPDAKHFCLRGGKGQHAGKGLNGNSKTFVNSFTSYRYGAKFIFGSDSILYTFSPPAIFLDLLDYAGIIGGIVEHHIREGHQQWPENGEDATQPGKPGSGGDGGHFVGIAPQGLGNPSGNVDTTGENCGNKSADVTGGRRGFPDHCAKWQVKLRNDGFRRLYRHSQTITESRKTTDGKSYKAPDADKMRGTDGSVKIQSGQDMANAWLHPALLSTVLMYVRDAYLIAPQEIDALALLLQEYRTALQSRPAAENLRPIIEKSGVEYDDTTYQHALSEVVTLLQRLNSHLDYFGQPCGWTPLFSLPACLRMYEDEVKRSLMSVVLARWISHKAENAREASAIAEESITGLADEVDKALQRIDGVQQTIRKLRDQAHSLQLEITDMSVRLDKKRNELLNKADQDARTKALINFGVSSVSALCQVIPYGQPALGALGAAGKTIADTIINETDPIEAAGPLSDILGEFIKSQLDEQAKDVVAAAKAEKKADPKSKEAAQTAAKLTHVGKAIGPALSSISDGIKGLCVSQSEVDARLMHLEAECPQFKEIVQALAALNVRKAEFIQKLGEALQDLSSTYTQVNSNLLSIGSLYRQQRESLLVLDHEALLYARSMDQQARIMLVKYLYYLAKCYEYAVLEPVAVNYQLTGIFDKISELVQGAYSDGEAARHADLLMPLFTAELRKIEDRLKTHYTQEYTGSMELRLSVDQTPDIMEQLNATGEALINLRDFNCIQPRCERVKIADVTVEKMDYQINGQPAPASGTVEFTMEPQGEAAMRKGNSIFVVRHPTSASSESVGRDSQQIWGVRYHFGSKEMEPIRPSKASLELLDYLLGDTQKSIQEKIANPAGWTNLKLRYTRHVRAPHLMSVLMKWSFNWTPADDTYCVIDLRMSDSCAPLLQCSPVDANGCSNGFGAIYRIYPKGTRVQIAAPTSYGRLVFSHWVVIDNTDTMEPRDVQESILRIDKMEHNMQIFCHYEEKKELHATEREQSPAVRELITSRFKSMPSEAEVEQFWKSESQRVKAHLSASRGGRLDAPPHGRPTRILNEPNGSNIAYLPQTAKVEVLAGPKEIDGLKWIQIDYRGVVGWVTTA